MSNNKTLQKEQARQLYFTTAHTQKAIANHLGITTKTMSAWVQSGNWAQLKQSRYHSPEQEVQQLYEELRTINGVINARNKDQRFATKEELEAKTKILALISGHLKNTSENWRNIAPEIDCEPIPEVIHHQQLSTPVSTTRRGTMHEEGERFDPKELEKCYNTVGAWFALADHEAEEYAREHNLPFKRSEF